jgi:hypothetical protein
MACVCTHHQKDEIKSKEVVKDFFQGLLDTIKYLASIAFPHFIL